MIESIDDLFDKEKSLRASLVRLVFEKVAFHQNKIFDAQRLDVNRIEINKLALNRHKLITTNLFVGSIVRCKNIQNLVLYNIKRKI